MELTHEYTHDVENRFKYLTWIVTFFALIIAGRLYYLQVVKGSYYRFFSERNSIKQMEVPAQRGMIYDRDGVLIVDNRPAFDVVAIPQYIRDEEKAVATLSNLLGMNKEEVAAELLKGAGLPSYYPVIIKSDVTLDEVSSIRAHKTPWQDKSDQFDLRGIDIQMRYARTYPNGESMSHLLGYLREIDPSRLKRYEENFPGIYGAGDFVGINGIEEVWDNFLRGKDGFDQKVVNAVGREVDWPDINLVRELPKNGANTHLTINADLQKIAREGLGDKSGAVVALDPNSGEVLALYSSPSYDLNKLSSNEGDKYWRQIAISPKKILYNRAIQGKYPPASTFKIVTAAAGLGEKAMKKDEHIFCGGGLKFGGRLYGCWKKRGHGLIAVVNAITSSCDTFFYQLGLKLGVDKIADYAKRLGFGKKTGIDLTDEKVGLIPTREWKKKRTGVEWQEGENLSVAIGQGFVTVTPTQSAVMISTIANGGKRVYPHIVSSIDGEGDSKIYEWARPSMDRVLDENIVKTIQEGLIGVVQSPSGTAYGLKRFDLKIAGKTGTAQVISREKWRSGVEEYKDHAWFVGYAPYDDPKIAVAVLVEHGGFGASAAAPIAGRIIEGYLKKNEELK